MILLPPLALLIGAGAGEAWRRWEARAARRPVWLAIVWGTTLLLGVAYLVSLPRILDLDRRLIAGMPESRPESFDDEIRLLAEVTGPSDFVIVDEPAGGVRQPSPGPAEPGRHVDGPHPLALAGRRCGRRSRRRAYDVRALFLFSDGLRSLQAGSRSGWTSEYVAIKINERPQRQGSRRLPAPATPTSTALACPGALASTSRSDATFGGQLRLLGHAVEPGEAGPAASRST